MTKHWKGKAVDSQIITARLWAVLKCIHGSGDHALSGVADATAEAVAHIAAQDARIKELEARAIAAEKRGLERAAEIVDNSKDLNPELASVFSYLADAIRALK